MYNDFMKDKYTCLFGGGAIRGISYVGAIKAFEELNITIDSLGGSSVGSILAAMLAVGYTADEMKDIFSNVNFNLFKDISIGLGPLFAVSKGEVFLEWVREVIEKKFYGDKYKKGTNKAVTFKDIDKELVIITTDLSSFECKEFSKHETPDYEIASAIRISCCMPGLMKPIEYNKMLLVDGDLQKSKPMWMLSKTLSKTDNRIIELRLEGYYENADISGIDYANAVYSCMTATASSFVKEIYGNNDKYECIVLNTGEILVVDFNINEEKRLELIESGYNQIMHYFTVVLPDKRVKIKQCYKNMFNHIIKIKKSIDSNNISHAKSELGELFIDIADCYFIIDKNYYNKILNFKNLFLQNIRYPALFGKVGLKNLRLVYAELTNLIEKLSIKIDEFELTNLS